MLDSPEDLRYEVEIDPRARTLASARPDVLRSAAARWPISAATPAHVADLLRASRRMFVHAAFLYDLFTVAAAWALLALEPALRERLNAGRNVSFQKLLERAAASGLVTEEAAEQIGAGIDLRHDFAHPKTMSLYSPGMSELAVETTHRVIADLYGSEATDE